MREILIHIFFFLKFIYLKKSAISHAISMTDMTLFYFYFTYKMLYYGKDM